MSKRQQNNGASHHKSLSHFFLPAQVFLGGADKIGSRVVLDDAAITHQIVHVLRLAEGNLVRLLDGLGNMWKAEICLSGRSATTFELLERLAVAESDAQQKCQIVSMLPLLKGPRFEWALEKLTELKVDVIMPFSSTRTVVKSKEKEESEGRQKRWQNIVREAAEQSERLLLPTLHAPISLGEMLKKNANDSSRKALNLLLSERDQAPNIVQLLSPILLSSEHHSLDSLRITLLGGPEGGFTEEEKSLILANDFQKVSLGCTILRGETAAILAAGIAYAIASTLD
ncbi:16S rRNA (uracil(1498)-N(3))-methyltransferase [soil metagenome]